MKKLRNFSKMLNRVELPKPAMAAENTIYIYDFIGEDFWAEGVTPKAVIDQLAMLDGADVNIRINSPGGYVSEGVAIHTAIKNYEGKKTVFIDGIAASAASFIALAGDEVLMAEGSHFMIHEAHGFSMGNAADLRKDAEVMEMMNKNIAGIYAAFTNSTTEEYLALMAEETWLDSAAAIEQGMATGMQEGHPVVNAVYDLSIYDNTPEVLQSVYNDLSAAPEETPDPIDVVEDADDPAPTFENISIRKRKLALIEAS